MSNVHRLLPKLALNRRFAQDLLAADAPCCGIGVVEERRQLYALMALRLGVAIPDGSSAEGFEFGHSLYGNASFEVIHFAFEFRGFATYHVLLNPSDPLVRSAVQRMIDQGGYFILTVAPDQRVTAFRAELGGTGLVGLVDNFPRLKQSLTTAAQYQQALTQFRRKPDPPGTVLEWVCREDPAYLDLTEDRLDLAPSAEDSSTPA
jgi:hypothetical protein